jgi:putative hemolysin
MDPDPFLVAGLPAILRWTIERVLGLATLRRLYGGVQSGAAGARQTEPFERRALRALGVELAVASSDLARVPGTGPVLVTANHPHGALDGLLLADLVRRVRPDVRVVANLFVQRVPELRDLCFFVDPFEGAGAAARSRAGLRAAHAWLRDGGALIVFPGGEVAHTWKAGALIDSPWKTTFDRIAASTGARILPASIDGHNSRLFYAAGHVHPRLRTLLLGRELTNKRGRAITVRIGHGNAIGGEIKRLAPEACLVESGSFQVFCAPSRAIPATLEEIGRLRELTYRAVGEGTGRDVDLDRFDEHYLHLFLWDKERQQVVGAYRIGQTDCLVAAGDVESLYTRTLFKYERRLLARLGAPALELGRSFIRAEYQKNYGALLLLWRGIGQFVVRNPHYRFLFGPVSVSARYSSTSHALLMEFLRQNHLDADLAALVQAMNPAAPRPTIGGVPPTIDDVNRMVARAEADGKGVPVLIRQYLKLNARLIAFNIDPAFGDALDALMVVDLAALDAGILKRYFGAADAAAYLSFHRESSTTRAA